MIKRFHEAPKCIFSKIQQMTDGDYALVHLFETDELYFKLFQDAVQKGREVILDNSVFELNKAFDPERFVYWINKLNPTYYIVPDVLEDYWGTRGNMEDWIENWLPKIQTKSKIIGVVQGDSFSSLANCYAYLDNVPEVRKIAISFDYSYYRKSFPYPNKYMSWALGRVKFLGDLEAAGILNKEKPHHLLGCGTPGEGIFYNSPDFNFIDSVDTSNPVVHGYEDISYNGPLGLTGKSSIKLYTIMNEEVSLGQWQRIVSNIQDFKRLWNGNYGDGWRLEIR